MPSNAKTLIINEIILFHEILKNRFITRRWNIMLASGNYLFLADEKTSIVFVTNVIILMKLWLVFFDDTVNCFVDG